MRASEQQEQTPICKKIQNYVFKFSDLLGQGNFSKVYTGVNEITSEIVAIKIVEFESLKSKKLEELLFSEIGVLKTLNHPSVLRCYDVFTSSRNCYIITELCNEGDLESKLRKHRAFPEARAQSLIRDIFEGLVYLNENQIIHRDIKVANIFIHNGKAKIADFGFAKFTREKFKDISIGSPLYMSPQGFVNNIYGPKTDVWAFGILIYELLHGYTPYSNCKTEEELRQCLSIPIVRSQFKVDISNELKEVILACMEVDEVKRVTISELKMYPYFRKQPNALFIPSQRSIGQGSSDRIRPPSYNEEQARNITENHKPESSIEGNFFSQQPRRKEKEPQTPTGSSFYPSSNGKNSIDISSDKFATGKERRAISSQRSIPNQFPISVHKQQAEVRQSLKNSHQVLRILSGTVTFKECVGIMHYARLIFKFLLTLKVSSYSNNNELFRLTRWLMDILSEFSLKMERGQVIYEGENAELRKRKLREVREEYYKKYCSQLGNYIQPQEHFGETPMSLDYMISFCFSICQKYDGLVTHNSPTPLLMLAHSVLLIYHTTKLIKNCYDAKNYSFFCGYKDVENFLALKKEQITVDSYLTSRRKVMPK